MKALIINWYIELFYKNLPNAFFIFIERDILSNAKSLLNIRKKYFDDINMWFSFKPREFELIRNLDNHSQVLGQVYFTNNEIKNQLSKIPSKNQMTINYENFCKNPEFVYKNIIDKLSQLGEQLSSTYNGASNFEVSEYDEDELKPFRNILELMRKQGLIFN